MDSCAESSSSSPGNKGQAHLVADWPRRLNFPTEIDRPAGRMEGAVSALTGQPMRYFVPDPLPELLQRCGDRKLVRESLPEDVPVALALARAAAHRNVTGKADEAQARRFCELIIGSRSHLTLDALIQLGTEISLRNKGIREEIVYAGGTVPSAAKIIFAPHGCLPQLVDSLLIGLETIDQDSDPGLVAAVTGFFCVSAHPFLDGNGRWSRLIAVAAGMRAGFATPAMSAVIFQNAGKQKLADDVWPETRYAGLRQFLELSLRFEEVLMAQLREKGITHASEVAWTQLRKSVKGRPAFQEVVLALYAQQGVRVNRLRELCGLSEKAMKGTLERVAHESNGLIDMDGANLSTRPLHEVINQTVQNTKDTVFNWSDSHA